MNTLRSALAVFLTLVAILVIEAIATWPDLTLMLCFVGPTAILFMLAVGLYDLYGIVVKGEARDPC